RKHADVVLAVTVDADGHVSNVEVLTSGGADLDQAAIVAVRQWTFVPAKRDGAALASRIRGPFHFAPPAPPPAFVEPEQEAEAETPVQRAVVPEQKSRPANPAVPTAPPAGSATAADKESSSTDVTVRGRAAPPSRGASDFHVEVGELARVPR